MDRKKAIFLKLVQIFVVWQKSEKIELAEGIKQETREICYKFFSSCCPTTCMGCGHPVGLSFIEKKHECHAPMFRLPYIPLEARVKAECQDRGMDYQAIWDSVSHKSVKFDV